MAPPLEVGDRLARGLTLLWSSKVAPYRQVALARPRRDLLPSRLICATSRRSRIAASPAEPDNRLQRGRRTHAPAATTHGAGGHLSRPRASSRWRRIRRATASAVRRQ